MVAVGLEMAKTISLKHNVTGVKNIIYTGVIIFRRTCLPQQVNCVVDCISLRVGIYATLSGGSIGFGVGVIATGYNFLKIIKKY